MAKIGIFDSGFGGLTVLKEIRAKLPEYDYIYLGDNARAPYGPKSQDLIYKYTCQAVAYLFDNDCELIVLACNTASAEALRKIQQEYLPEKYPGKRVLGVIIPTAEKIVEDGFSRRVGVIATEGTAHSQTYVNEIAKLDPSVEVFQNPAPLLVPLIEQGEIRGADIDKHLEGYLGPLVEEGIDSLILGCTHYAIIESEIRKLLREDIKIYNQSAIVADKLADYLHRHPETEIKLMQDGGIRFLSTDSAENFGNFVKNIWGQEIQAEQIVLK